MYRNAAWLRWFGTLVCVLAVLGLAQPEQALAHAVPERANPPMNSAVPVMPSTVEIWFSEDVSAEGVSLTVLKLDGTQVDRGNAALDLTDPTRTRVTVGVHPGLDNGEYLVQWTVVSAVDGDSTSGSYQFIVDPAASPVALPQVATQQAPAQLPVIDAEGNPVPQDDNRLLYGIAAAVTGAAFLGLLAFWFFRRPSRGRRWSDRPVDRL
ncbi:MAG: copper resistance protein CopC [Thermomicrobiales bacterium]